MSSTKSSSKSNGSKKGQSESKSKQQQVNVKAKEVSEDESNEELVMAADVEHQEDVPVAVAKIKQVVEKETRPMVIGEDEFDINKFELGPSDDKKTQGIFNRISYDGKPLYIKCRGTLRFSLQCPLSDTTEGKYFQLLFTIPHSKLAKYAEFDAMMKKVIERDLPSKKCRDGTMPKRKKEKEIKYLSFYDACVDANGNRKTYTNKNGEEKELEPCLRIRVNIIKSGSGRVELDPNIVSFVDAKDSSRKLTSADVAGGAEMDYIYQVAYVFDSKQGRGVARSMIEMYLRKDGYKPVDPNVQIVYKPKFTFRDFQDDVSVSGSKRKAETTPEGERSPKRIRPADGSDDQQSSSSSTSSHGDVVAQGGASTVVVE